MPGRASGAVLSASPAQSEPLAYPSIDAGYPFDDASAHGVSEAIYLHDPDRNGVELYVYRPESAWPRDSEGHLEMGTERLDLAALLAET